MFCIVLSDYDFLIIFIVPFTKCFILVSVMVEPKPLPGTLQEAGIHPGLDASAPRAPRIQMHTHSHLGASYLSQSTVTAMSLGSCRNPKNHEENHVGMEWKGKMQKLHCEDGWVVTASKIRTEFCLHVAGNRSVK